MKLALERDWNVRATTRSLDKHGARLQAIARDSGAERCLTIHECDLSVEGAFDEVVSGCDVVFHTASPFFNKGFGAEHVSVAVEGTKNVLTSCIKNNVRKIALTSSTAAIYAWFGKHPADHVMTEADWSDMDEATARENWYCVSKTRAEQLAWKMAEDNNLQLAVMNPCLIFGPMLQTSLNTSSEAIYDFASGKKSEIPNCTKCIVDVRDVAEAHILAFEKNAGWGSRHLLVGACPPWSEIVEEIRQQCPEASRSLVPRDVSETVGEPSYGAPPPHATPFDVSRATALGVQFRSTAEMVSGTMESLVAHGFLQ